MKKDQIKAKKNEERKRQQNGDEEEKDSNVKQENGNEVKNEVKLQSTQVQKKWYEKNDLNEDDPNKKWDYLEHHGVIFPKRFIPKNIPILYDGEKVELTPEEEELATYWCQSLNLDYAQNPIYIKNFATQFLQRFIKQKTKYTNFEKFDFSPMVLELERAKAEKKARPEQQVKKEKEAIAENNKLFTFAIVDDTVQKLNGFMIEPSTLFKGRGAHPKAGYLKIQAMPEDITLNLARDAPIPPCPMPGHAWGAIVCKQDATWLCSYKNDSISSNAHHKYVFLSANSKFKGKNDVKKYEKARRLKLKIKQIRQDYLKKIQDKDMKVRQIGVATYLIDTLALRAGNDKDSEEEADTVGCCSLKVNNVELLPDNQLKLDFLGKDSIRYENTVTIKEQVWKAIQGFIKNKKPEEELFDKIDTQTLNDYLKSKMEGLTAKVFRTYNASITLENELKKTNPKGKTSEEQKNIYDEANKQVAILCNHQRTVTKKQVESLKIKQKAIEAMQEYVKDLEKHKSKFSAKNEKIQREAEVVKVEGGKQLIKKFPDTKDATINLIKKTQQKIVRERNILKKKEQNKQVALTTSKTNYNDPRISVAWCKKNEVKIEVAFPKTLISKFVWAMYTDKDFQF